MGKEVRTTGLPASLPPVKVSYYCASVKRWTDVWRATATQKGDLQGSDDAGGGGYEEPKKHVQRIKYRRWC